MIFKYLTLYNYIGSLYFLYNYSYGIGYKVESTYICTIKYNR